MPHRTMRSAVVAVSVAMAASGCYPSIGPVRGPDSSERVRLGPIPVFEADGSRSHRGHASFEWSPDGDWTLDVGDRGGMRAGDRGLPEGFEGMGASGSDGETCHYAVTGPAVATLRMERRDHDPVLLRPLPGGEAPVNVFAVCLRPGTPEHVRFSEGEA